MFVSSNFTENMNSIYLSYIALCLIPRMWMLNNIRALRGWCKISQGLHMIHWPLDANYIPWCKGNFCGWPEIVWMDFKYHWLIPSCIRSAVAVVVVAAAVVVLLLLLLLLLFLLLLLPLWQILNSSKQTVVVRYTSQRKTWFFETCGIGSILVLYSIVIFFTIQSAKLLTLLTITFIKSEFSSHSLHLFSRPMH